MKISLHDPEALAWKRRLPAGPTQRIASVEATRENVRSGSGSWCVTLPTFGRLTCNTWQDPIHARANIVQTGQVLNVINSREWILRAWEAELLPRSNIRDNLLPLFSLQEIEPVQGEWTDFEALRRSGSVTSGCWRAIQACETKWNYTESESRTSIGIVM